MLKGSFAVVCMVGLSACHENVSIPEVEKEGVSANIIQHQYHHNTSVAKYVAKSLIDPTVPASDLANAGVLYTKYRDGCLEKQTTTDPDLLRVTVANCMVKENVKDTRQEKIRQQREAIVEFWDNYKKYYPVAILGLTIVFSLKDGLGRCREWLEDVSQREKELKIKNNLQQEIESGHFVNWKQKTLMLPNLEPKGQINPDIETSCYVLTEAGVKSLDLEEDAFIPAFRSPIDGEDSKIRQLNPNQKESRSLKRDPS